MSLTRADILEQISEILKDVFGDNSLKITENTTANDIAKWDSLNHITIMMSIEDQFSIEFDMEKMHTLKNIGAIIDIVARANHE